MKIKILVMDVDGTLTDGKIYIGNKGEVMKVFNVKDGYGIAKLNSLGIVTSIITGRKSEILKIRAEELKIKEIYQGEDQKINRLKELVAKYNYDLLEVAYIGDDENDIECMKLCGISACPSDAVEMVQNISDYVCVKTGGDGAVREFIEYLIAERI
jgi:3-deoxy-D-manno-octulosonate 8-phosphate phosphatase (KDO 8-P phosphatase)